MNKPKHTAICLHMGTDYHKSLTLKAHSAGMSVQALIMQCINEHTGLIDTVARRGPLVAPPGQQPPLYIHVDEKRDGGLMCGSEMAEWFTQGWIYKVPDRLSFVIDIHDPQIDRTLDIQYLLHKHPDAEMVFMNVNIEGQSNRIVDRSSLAAIEAGRE